MKKIEIIENNVQDVEVVRMTELEILYKIEKDGLINFLQNYSLSEEFILKWCNPGPEFTGMPKNIIITMMGLSEEFIMKAIEIDYFELDDIYELNMMTYSNLSDKFTQKYEKYINWERMILYLCSSEKVENIEKFEWVIEKFNLWGLISANELPIDFIRKNKDKLDWRIVSIINEFSEENKNEFEENIPDFREEWDKHFNEEPTSSGFITEIKDIRKIIKSSILEDNNNQEKRFEVKHSIDDLTPEDMKKIKEMIQSGKINNF